MSRLTISTDGAEDKQLFNRSFFTYRPDSSVIPPADDYVALFSRVSLSVTPEYIIRASNFIASFATQMAADLTVNKILELANVRLNMGVGAVPFVSYSIYKYPAVYVGNDFFTFDGYKGYYTIDNTQALNIKTPVYRYKFYVFTGFNNMTLFNYDEYFSYIHTTKRETLNLWGIDTGVGISAGLTFNIGEGFYGLGLDFNVNVDVTFPYFYYGTSETLVDLFGGSVSYYGDGQYYYISGCSSNIGDMSSIIRNTKAYSDTMEVLDKLEAYGVPFFENSYVGDNVAPAFLPYLNWAYMPLVDGKIGFNVRCNCLINKNMPTQIIRPTLYPYLVAYPEVGAFSQEKISFLYPLLERVN